MRNVLMALFLGITGLFFACDGGDGDLPEENYSGCVDGERADPLPRYCSSYAIFDGSVVERSVFLSESGELVAFWSADPYHPSRGSLDRTVFGCESVDLVFRWDYGLMPEGRTVSVGLSVVSYADTVTGGVVQDYYPAGPVVIVQN